MARVQVVAFWLDPGGHDELSGLREMEMTVPEGSRIEDLIHMLLEKHPGAKVVDVMPMLNSRPAQGDTVLHDGDRVQLFPPLMGG